MEPKTIIFIGPQGSGKGTQIEKLTAALREKDSRRVVDIQTGRRFRGLAATGEGYTEHHVQKTLDTGVLQPLFLSVMLWGDAMRSHANPECHLVIDGFPRTVHEAHVLESALNFYGRKTVDVINLEIDENVVRSRVQLRARSDDTSESIEVRLGWYRNETLPVVEYFRNRDAAFVHDMHGAASVEEVYVEILTALSLNDL